MRGIISEESDKDRYEAQLSINQDLRTENAFLREALEHFLFCRSCEVDEDFQYCELGKQYADKLGIITFADTKVV